MVYGKVKRLAPRWLKRPVKEALLRRQLRGAIRSIGNLAPGQVPDRGLLSELIVGWSNDGFVANQEYLDEVARRSVDTKGPILECGTGITTVLLGILCGKRQIDVWSLEHFPQWHNRVTSELQHNGISGAHVCLAPLVEYAEFVWYDPPLAQMPNEFSLVICDGPPGNTKGGRYGLLPVMRGRLPPGSTILLDDAGRPGELELIKRWEAEARFETNVIKSEGHEFAVMRRLS